MNERELFLSALEIDDPQARQAHLESACAGDVGLLARVTALLASHEGDSRFLNIPVVQQIADEAAEGPEGTIALGNSPTPDAAKLPSKAGSLTPEDRDKLDNETLLGCLQPSSRPDSMGRLAHYDVLEVLGRGAFGTVLRAFDEKLQRVVAIKVLSPLLAATSPARKRFLREARNSAQIRHKNVVRIYAVDDDPIPYLVMEYIPGQTLQQRLDEYGPLDLPDVLRLGKQIADGLDAAHAQELIHRDIKPGNILLESDLDDHVQITDFGLARTADDASMTQSGIIAGTPLYMAPEQALGQKLDQRADLFSFGSVLYQMLTGRPPFRAPSTLAVLKRVVEDTPRPMREILPEVPEWMCQIISRLHEKNPEDRYASAREVGDLLEHCLTELQQGRIPVVASPQRPTSGSAAPNGSKPAARPPWRRWSFSLAAVLLVGVVGMGVTQATGVTQLATTVVRLWTGAGTLVVETNDPGVKVTIDGEGVTVGGAGIEEVTLRPGKYTIAAFKDGKPVQQELVSIARNGRTVVRMSLESAGQGIQSGDGGQKSSAGAAPTAPFVTSLLPEHPSTRYCIVYSPDGQLLACGGRGDVRVFGVASGTLQYVLPVAETSRFIAITFSPDGKFLLTAPEDPASAAPISIWEAETGKPAGALEGHTAGLYDLSFSPDGKTLVSGGHYGFMRLWDFAARRKIRDIPSESRWTRSAVFSKEGTIAFGQDKVFLADQNGKLLRTIDKYAGPLCFSPDGRHLAGTTWREGLVTVWDVETGEEIGSWRAHDGLAEGVAFSRGGNVLATAGSDATVRLWDYQSQRLLAELPHDEHVNWVAFSPDGITMATAGYEPRVKIWDVSAIVAP